LVTVSTCAAEVVPGAVAGKVRLVGEKEIIILEFAAKLMVYAAEATALFVRPVATAIAFRVSVVLTVIGPE
jgi:hypothetical protein